MKQRMFTIEIETPPIREERKLRRWRAAADGIYAVVTAAACVAVVVLAVIGLAYCLGGRPCTVSPVVPPVEAPAPVESVGAGLALDPEAVPAEDVPTPNPAEASHTSLDSWDTPLTAAELDALLTACQQGHIESSVGLGLIQVESGFDAAAVNPVSGFYGYCQLNPAYFPAGLSPEENITVGIGYLVQQLEHYEDLEAALTAYNAGHDTGDRTYARRVMGATEEWTR